MIPKQVLFRCSSDRMPWTGCRQEQNATGRRSTLPLAARFRYDCAVPIRPDMRWFYPIDWCELSIVIRFDRAGGRCERCRRPHGRDIIHLGDGRWFDDDAATWRDDRGRRLTALPPPPSPALFAQYRLTYLAGDTPLRVTRICLASAHLDHDPGNNRLRNPAALCQRCHLANDRPEHRRQRWRTLFRRRAIGDLFVGSYR